jgi:protein SCO1/2/putative membrane protein
MSALRKLLWVAVFAAALATAIAGVLALARVRPTLHVFGDLGDAVPENLAGQVWLAHLREYGCDRDCLEASARFRRLKARLAAEAKLGFLVIPTWSLGPLVLSGSPTAAEFELNQRQAEAKLAERFLALAGPPAGSPGRDEIVLPIFGNVGDWVLTGSDGKPFGSSDLKDRIWIADFVFTRCAGPCPIMCEGMEKLVKRLPPDPRLKFVSFSVDPGYDTPEVLREFATQWKADLARWKFVTGVGVYKISYDGFKLLARPNPEPTVGDQVIHSTRFTLVDGEGRMRGLYTYNFERPESLPATLDAIVRDTQALLDSPERVVDHFCDPRLFLVDRLGRLRGVAGPETDVEALVDDVRKLSRAPEKLISLRTLPRLNAVLNGTSFLLLTTGFLFILKRQVTPHRVCMSGALVASFVFLGSYVYYHVHAGSVRYPGEGLARTAYLGLLGTHTILAAVVAPMALVTVWRALRERFDRHRAIARWTLPIWLYVSLTGILVYLLLYELA